MSSIFEPTIDYFLRTRRQNIKSSQHSSMRRTILPIGKQITVRVQKGKSFASNDSIVLHAPLSGDRQQINMKARLYLRSRMSRLGSPIERQSEFDDAMIEMKARGRGKKLRRGLGRLIGRPLGGIGTEDGDGDGFVTGPDGEDNVPAPAAAAISAAADRVTSPKAGTSAAEAIPASKYKNIPDGVEELVRERRKYRESQGIIKFGDADERRLNEILRKDRSGAKLSPAEQEKLFKLISDRDYARSQEMAYEIADRLDFEGGDEELRGMFNILDDIDAADDAYDYLRRRLRVMDDSPAKDILQEYYDEFYSQTRRTAMGMLQDILDSDEFRKPRKKDASGDWYDRYGQIKVGLVGSSSPIGRGAQAAASFVLPGNLSPYRSPIRSGLYRALTPGGGGGRGALRAGARGAHRCPAGFEFGGRFTDSRFSTCGAQLFEIPGPLALIARAIRRIDVPNARAESLSQVLEGTPTQDRTIQIQRLAQIPRNAAPNRDAFNKAVFDSIKTLKAAPAGEGRMVRRDGIVLRPIVPSSVLRQFSGNPDMLDGAMVRAVQTAEDISPDDLGLLAGPSMSRIAFVAPNGVTINIQRDRPLTVGERRKFGRQLNRAVGGSDPYDIGSNIRQFAEGSGGAFKYSEDYAGLPEPLEFVEYTGPDGVVRKVRKWVYETFVKPNLPKMRAQRERRVNIAEQVQGTPK